MRTNRLHCATRASLFLLAPCNASTFDLRRVRCNHTLGHFLLPNFLPLLISAARTRTRVTRARAECHETPLQAGAFSKSLGRGKRTQMEHPTFKGTLVFSNPLCSPSAHHVQKKPLQLRTTPEWHLISTPSNQTMTFRTRPLK